jgi:ABC-2 type transport system ATP-binding protein
VRSIEFRNLTKQYGEIVAVDDLTVSISPGRVTGFLGPNGAGKSTALRCLLGLAKPTRGAALIGGQSYQELTQPLKIVGAMIDNRGFGDGLTGIKNLKIEAAAAGIDDARVSEVLALVELDNAGKRKVKEYSLGMRQRLGIAAVLLGKPEVLVLDEPGNGLDPIGINWLRGMLQELAKAGHTVLISSHQLAELQNTVDDVLIINNGRLLASGSIAEICGNDDLESAFLRIVSGRHNHA